MCCCCRSLLIGECECPEEGTRNVVAECLGKLTLIDPDRLLPKLKEHLRMTSPLIRATVVTAVKFTISDQVRELTLLLSHTYAVDLPNCHFARAITHVLYF